MRRSPEITGAEASTFNILAAPAGTPPEVMAVLSDATRRVMGDSGFQLGAAAGRYDLGRELGGAYNDYELSLARSFGPVATKLAYVTTSGYNDTLSESLGERHLASGRAILSLGYEF